MFIIKIILGVSCVIICSKIAINRANLIKFKYLYFESALMLCNSMLCDIEYKKSSLSKNLSLKFSSYDFTQTVNYFIKNNQVLTPNYLLEEEKINVNAFFNELGKSDTNSQKLSLNFYKNYFLKLSNEKKLEYSKTYQITLKVGFSIGVMLFVLVI